MPMDRQIKRKRLPPRRLAALAAAALFVGVSAYGLLKDSGVRKLNVERDKLTVSSVERGPFQEYTSVRGTVLPKYTVYLDALEGGTVDTLHVEAGALVAKGDPLLRVTNAQTELTVYNQQAEATRQLDDLRRGQLSAQQTLLGSRQNVMQAQYDFRTKKRRYDRYGSLADTVRLAIIARQEWERIEDEFTHARHRLDLERQRHQQDSLLVGIQLRQLQASLRTTERNLAAVRQRMANLTLRAPVAGQLSALAADLGERIAAGTRLGQIDVLDGFKIRAAIDEYYIARIASGQQGECGHGDAVLPLRIRKVYPDVEAGRFEVDLDFTGAVPRDLRRGQTVHVRLQLGDLEEAVQVARGGFYQTTGGNWAYVVDEDGDRARRRPIRLGRQNPKVYEVLEGLAPGEQVITSGYENFGEDMDVLVLH
jgi:HlyD family secretion protein